MPDISQAEIGRRMYHVHREKRVEQAIRMMQQAIGTEWRSFTGDEARILGHLLQCTWNTIDQKSWDAIPFGKATAATVRGILSHGTDVKPGRNPSPEAVAEIRNILLSLA